MTQLKIFILSLALTIVVVFAVFKDGPYGPPILQDQRGGNFIISAPVWFSADEVAQDYATIACLSRYFNTSVAGVELQGSRYLYLSDTIRIPMTPRWIKVYCSP